MADEIAGWAALPETVATTRTEIHRGDWRARFRNGFEASGVLVIEMDPMRFEHHDPPQGRDDRAVLFTEDLQLVVAAIASLNVPVALQISSFSANNGNPHRSIEPAITGALSMGRFALQGRVEANGNMISLVYGRGLQLWPAPAAPLSQRFTQWLRTI